MGGQREMEDMRRWIRGEFDKWRHITDEVYVKDKLVALSPSPCIHTLCIAHSDVCIYVHGNTCAYIAH